MMAEYSASDGLDFGIATPARYLDAKAAAGFVDGTTSSRNAWYRMRAREELERLKGDVGAAAGAGAGAAKVVGQDSVGCNIGIWTQIIPVPDSGELCPTHLSARKPG